MNRFHPSIVALLAVATAVAIAALLYRFGGAPADDAPAPPVPSKEARGPRLERLPGFADRAREAGLDFQMRFLPDEQGERFKVNLYDHGCGVAIADYDGDGRDDLYFLNQLGPNALFRNRGDGTFQNVTEDVGPLGIEGRISVSAVFADYDNDADQDLYVTSTRGGNTLFRNDGGTFVDATEQAGVAWVGHSQTATFFDYDDDGYLDLYLTNSASWTTDEFNSRQNAWSGLATFVDLRRAEKEYNVMFRNRGDGTFDNVTDLVGLAGQGWGGDAVAFDYDRDGRLDLLVTNMFGLSQLYRNEDDGRFRDVTDATLLRSSFGAIGAKAFDYNNDGLLDLFVADMHSDMWLPLGSSLELIDETQKFDSLMGPIEVPSTADIDLMSEVLLTYGSRVVFGNTLFKNLDGGRFEEVSDAANMETFWPWGVATGDFDNDGFEDVFLPSGMGYPFNYWPNQLMLNRGDGTFDDQAEVRGIEPPIEGVYLKSRIGGQRAARSSRCAAVADFDGDGRLEIVTNNFNDRPYYFRNEFPPQNFIAFRLTGTASNRDAIGAVVACYIGKEVLVRQVHAAGGYLSQSSKTVHFGLGSRAAVDRAEIRWPSGRVQSIESPAINRLSTFVEM